MVIEDDSSKVLDSSVSSAQQEMLGVDLKRVVKDSQADKKSVKERYFQDDE